MLRTMGHVGLRQPLYMTSIEGEDCPWSQAGSHKAESVLPDLCPHFCDPQSQVDLPNAPLLSCVQGCQRNGLEGGLFRLTEAVRRQNALRWCLSLVWSHPSKGSPKFKCGWESSRVGGGDLTHVLFSVRHVCPNVIFQSEILAVGHSQRASNAQPLATIHLLYM